MEQHPVPQQISSYEFRLVGDMTLKQFAQVAGGCLIALLFYASPLPGFLKWPLVILFIFTGVAMAFLPFEERPLQTWIVAFLKAVYSPTQFIWQKKGRKLEVFEERVVKTGTMIPSPVVSRDTQKLTDYLAHLPSSQSPLEEKEKIFVDRVENLFASVSAPPISTPPTEPPPSPQPQVLPRYAPPLPTGFARYRQRKIEEARFTPQIPMPSVPTLPNVLVGMVTDPEGKILEGAIMEIRDSQGNPVRAFRTNKLGQFRIVTPLPNDTYEIEIEKEGFQFDIIRVALKGEIVQPIEIRAKQAQMANG